MEPLLYHLYSGHLFFSSAAVLLSGAIAVLAGTLERRPILRSVTSVFVMASIPAAALSGTPMPAWQAAAGIAATLPFALFGIVAPPRRRAILGSIAIVVTVGLVAAELRWHLAPRSVPPPRRLIVIGDSLSSGGFGESRSWPLIVAAKVGAEVENLSFPGETAETAEEGQLPNVPPPRAGDCVVVAIGGNDMLDGLSARDFEASVDRILTVAGAGGTRRVVMLELPIIPGEWRFGTVQRRLAAEHRATLLPKRLIAGVLLAKGCTSDGLHPTQKGHESLATEITRALHW